LEELRSKIKNPYPHTNVVRQKRKDATVCHICEQEIASGEKKVVDHEHFTGVVRDIAHDKCNKPYNLKG